MEKWELFLSWSNTGTISERFHVFWKKDEKRFFMGLDMIK